jgi:isocitrate dehydrogenase
MAEMDINILKTQDAITTFDRARVAWAGATTDPSSHRRKDLRDKVRAVIDFFVWVNKPVQVITPGDIKKWQEELVADQKSFDT